MDRNGMGKAIALLVTLLMIGSAMVVMLANTRGASVTNNNAPEALVLPGATNVLVANFTLDGTIDVTLAGTKPGTGKTLTTNNPWSDVYFYDDGDGVWENTKDAIWQDDGEVYYDVGIDTHIAGVNTENTGRGTTTNPWASAEQPVVFYDSGTGGTPDGTWSEDDDWIGLDGYIKEIKVENTGTATQNEIDNLFLWIDDGDKKFEPADGDTPTPLSPSATDDKVWEQTLSPNLKIDGTQVYFITADISSIDSDFSVKRNTIKMKVEVKVINSPTATFSFTNKYTQRIALLGITYFEGNQGGPADVIVTDTKDIKYGATVRFTVNSSALTDGTKYTLYYPHFKRSDGDYEIEWLEYKPEGSGEPVTVTADGDKVVPVSAPVHFNVSGMWILDDDGNPTNAAEGTDDDFAYFWVNGTETYSIEVTKDEVYYGKNETITITVTENGTAVPVWIDVRKESDEYEEPILHQWCPDGKLEFTADWDNFTIAGNYTIVAYRDLDDDIIGYETQGFTEWYGLSQPDLTTVSGYSEICGPWDPPEEISAVKKIVVKTGEPTLEIPEVNRTMHWSFPGEVKIYIKGYDGENLTFSSSDVKVYNSKGDDVTSHLTINADTGVIKIYSDSWGKDGTVWGKNGTWKVASPREKERIQCGAAESDRMEYLPRSRRHGSQDEKGDPGANHGFNSPSSVILRRS